MNRIIDGYTKRDDIGLTTGAAGAEQMKELIERSKTVKKAARAWSFAVFEDGKMSGATWFHNTAIVLDYVVGDDWKTSLNEIHDAAVSTGLGFYLLSGEDRYKVKTLAVVFPMTEPATKEQYARLVYVLSEEMKANGCGHFLVKGTSAMTHQLHINQDSDVIWSEGSILPPKAKIKATKFAAQNFDRDRFTIGAAARAQLDPPTLTACDPGLFEGL